MKGKEHVYNSFFDKDKWEKVNIVNKEIMEDYTMELKQNQKKPSTIKVYRNDWRIVFLVIYDMFKNKTILELTKKDYLIQLGDFGFFWHNPPTKEEKHWLQFMPHIK
jgi:hypothetical protein